MTKAKQYFARSSAAIQGALKTGHSGGRHEAHK